MADFDPKQYVRPRKSLKVMSRDIQLAFAAADLACVDAGLRDHPIAPERLGVVFGAALIPGELDELIGTYRNCMIDGKFDFRRWGPAAMAELFPLWMLKYLPNMPACHIGIGQDARGPNNSITIQGSDNDLYWRPYFDLVRIAEAEEQNGARRGCPTLYGFFPTDPGVHEAFDGSAYLPSSQLRAGRQELPYHCDWLHGWASPLGRHRGEGWSRPGR